MRAANSSCVMSKPRSSRILLPTAFQSTTVRFIRKIILDSYLYIYKIYVYRLEKLGNSLIAIIIRVFLLRVAEAPIVGQQQSSLLSSVL
jgi:hypothetical protein